MIVLEKTLVEICKMWHFIAVTFSNISGYDCTKMVQSKSNALSVFCFLKSI